MTETLAKKSPQQYGTEEHQVWLGDVPRALDEIPDSSCDLIFADPPYNIGKKYNGFIDRWPSDEAYVEWCSVWLDKCLTKLTPTGSMYIMTSTQSMPFIDIYLRDKLTVLSRIVWHYDSSGVQARKYFGSLWEPILHCVKDPKRYTFNADDIKVEARTGATRKLIDYRKAVPTEYSTQKVPGNAWYFPRVRYRMAEYEDHPSQKPEALLERIVRASSHEGDTVMDLFAGTFTTSAVGRRLGRRTIGIEADEEYVGVGLRRLELATEFNGKKLEAIPKNTARKNGRGRKSATVDEQETLL